MVIINYFQDYLTPLHVAAHCGNVRAAKHLLDSNCVVDSRALVCIKDLNMRPIFSLRYKYLQERKLQYNPPVFESVIIFDFKGLDCFEK